MATYKEFQDALLKNNMGKDNFSDADWALAKKNPEAGLGILYAKRDWGAATTDAERNAAHANAERARLAGGGYTGGSDGSGYVYQGATPSSFQRKETPTYQNAYAGQVGKALNAVTNRAPFQYDASSDPLWGQYQEMYRREGQRAMQDTLGQAAARTGGMASSYAASAAAQANNYYMQQMADKLPELQQLAYEQYQQEYQNDLARLNALRQAQQDDYARYLDLVTQTNRENEANYSQHADQIAYLADERDREAKQKQQNVENAYNLWIATGVADEEIASALGVPVGARTADYDLNEWKKGYQERQLEAELANQEYEKQYQQAVLGGTYGDYTGLAGLGIKPNTGNMLAAALASGGRTQPVGSGGSTGSKKNSSGGESGGESQNSEIESQALEALRRKYGDSKVITAADWSALRSQGVSETFLKDNGYSADYYNGNRTSQQYDALAGSYGQVNAVLKDYQAKGASRGELAAMLKDAKDNGVLNGADYQRLYNIYCG